VLDVLCVGPAPACVSTGRGSDRDVDADGNPIEVPIEVPVEIPTVTAGTSAATSSFASHTTKAGFAVGAGAEVRLVGNWTGKVEYLYLDFGRVSTSATNPLNSTPLAINFDSRVTSHIARVGLNYKFDPTGAAYAASADAKSPMLFKAPVLAAWTWAGPYVGGTIGYSAGKSKTDTIFSDPGRRDRGDSVSCLQALDSWRE
jgi:opacity protein-like surface antigen